FKDAVKEGRCFFTNGPFVEMWVNENPLGSLITDTDGTANVQIKVQAPPWMTVDTLNLIVNGAIYQTISIPSSTNVVRLNQTYTVTLTKDSWIAAEVKGGACETDSSNNCLTPGCPGRMDPIVPPMYGTDPVCPYAHTNPIYVDYNNNGVFDPPGNMGYAVEPISATRPVDSNYQYSRLNQVVTVRGTVTAGSYTFDHSSNTPFFQDDSQDLINHLSGGTTIYQSRLINPEVVPGDKIEVTGTITNYNGLLEMSGVSITKLAKGAVPDPKVVTISQLNGSNGEQYEGMLVRINNVTGMTGTWPVFGKNASMTITDSTGSITMYIDSNTDCDGTSTPVAPFDVIGVVSQYKTSSPYNSGFEIKP
ncbi:MAG: hypothetical protein N2445_08795, partial [Acidobacteria bacterium]|nr:hypothetical protein [Acidobacteriota bacterium]